MSTKIRQTEFEHFDRFRTSHHLGSGLIEIEVREYKSSIFGGKWYWKRIYLGHDTPIRKSLQLYDDSRDLEKKDKQNGMPKFPEDRITKHQEG